MLKLFRLINKIFAQKYFSYDRNWSIAASAWTLEKLLN